MINCKSIAIIEAKYKARKEYIPKIIGQAETFRKNFPAYASHRILLAIAALSFADKDKTNEVEQEFINEGIAVIKQVGETVIINDTHLKAF
jgi:hypothetical protein